MKRIFAFQLSILCASLQLVAQQSGNTFSMERLGTKDGLSHRWMAGRVIGGRWLPGDRSGFGWQASAGLHGFADSDIGNRRALIPDAAAFDPISGKRVAP